MNQSSIGAVRKRRWTTWAPVSSSPYGLWTLSNTEEKEEEIW